MSNSLVSDRFYFSSNVLALIHKYSGSTFVVKYGGSVMQDLALRVQFIQDLSLLHSCGIKIVLVHGGGAFINHWLNKLDIVPCFDNGIRITDSQTMEVVEMVLVGKVNKQLVGLINQHEMIAVGLSGQDANLIVASPMSKMTNNFTGQVENVNPDILELLLLNKYIPVIASVASDSQGNRYNVNADTIASAIASSLKAEKLILVTDIPGVLMDVNDYSTLVKDLNLEMINNLRCNNTIVGGMIPKIQSCIDAINNNVQSAHIIDGTIRHSLLYEVLTDERVGSMITL